MDIELFKRVIDECEENGTGAITLASRGEPTLHPKFCEMLEYASGKFFEIKINTNGTRLTDEICHSIFKNEVNDIVLSIDTEQKDLFEKYRKNASFDEVVENVKNLHNIRKKFYPNSITAIRISGVYCGPDQDNEKFSEFWGQWADEITISDVEERWDTYNNPIHPDLSTPCAYVWERFYVWWDGVCNPCDVDYKSKLSLGTLDENNSIKDIWNSKEYKLLRLNHENGMRSGCFPCDRC
jgi:MoaA/NifB/PqqE/SkfB family radical SAM enzyme